MIRSMTIALCLAAAPASAAEIAVAPGDRILLNPANPGRGYSDLVIHSIGVRAGAGEHFKLGSIRIDLMSGPRIVLSEYVTGDQMMADTRRLASAPIPAFVAGQLLDPRGLDGLFGKATQAASSSDLAPGQALLVTGHYYAIGSPVDSVRITLEGRSADGALVTAERIVPVGQYRSPIDYRPPLKGAWLMQAIPTLQSHHRLNPSTEYAVDFFKVDGEGRLAGGDPLVAADHYGYGAEVTAAADGVVVRVVDGETQDRAAMSRRVGETPQAAGERIGAFVMQRMKADFGRAAAGNLVTLKHEKDSVVEYSSYGHLRQGILVREGQRVSQGQAIGQVGDTGDSTAVHLHFQINAGPDPFTTKSLPARFTGLRNAGGNSELGRFVVAE